MRSNLAVPTTFFTDMSVESTKRSPSFCLRATDHRSNVCVENTVSGMRLWRSMHLATFCFESAWMHSTAYIDLNMTISDLGLFRSPAQYSKVRRAICEEIKKRGVETNR